MIILSSGRLIAVCEGGSKTAGNVVLCGLCKKGGGRGGSNIIWLHSSAILVSVRTIRFSFSCINIAHLSCRDSAIFLCRVLTLWHIISQSSVACNQEMTCDGYPAMLLGAVFEAMKIVFRKQLDPVPTGNKSKRSL